MFLFTNAPVSSASVKNASPKDAPLSDAMRSASADTGVSFDYLMKTAKRESNLDSSAKAKTSSASGLYQFLDQTWLSTVKAEGAKFGLESEASQIVQGKNGRLSVSDSDARAKILGLRNDPAVSSKLAAAFTLRNQAQLLANLGRAPSEGELYIAHFLGAGGAGDLIRIASESPDSSAAKAFPDAASANKALFYGKSGEIKTVAELYSTLVSRHESGLADTNAATGSQDNTYKAKNDAKPVLGLFQGSETGPVAKPIQNAWSNMGRNSFGTGGRQLASLSSSSLSPASLSASSSFSPHANEAVASNEQANSMADVPLPPDKPFALGSNRQSKQNAPLDLLSFIRQR